MEAVADISQKEQSIWYHPGTVEEYDSAYGNADSAWYSCCGQKLWWSRMSMCSMQALQDRPPKGCALRAGATPSQQAAYEAAVTRLEVLRSNAMCLRCEGVGHIRRYCPHGYRCLYCGRWDHQTNSCQLALQQNQSDWRCSRCRRVNFSARLFCSACSAPAPPPATGSPSTVRTTAKPGDWCCSCGVLNFASRKQCYKCQGPRPSASGGLEEVAAPGSLLQRQAAARQAEAASSSGSGPAVQPGDWSCPHCGVSNFARRQECFKCGGGREPVPAPASCSLM